MSSVTGYRNKNQEEALRENKKGSVGHRHRVDDDTVFYIPDLINLRATTAQQ